MFIDNAETLWSPRQQLRIALALTAAAMTLATVAAHAEDALPPPTDQCTPGTICDDSWIVNN